jgi:CRISPR/Cas system CMR-associated protein Cmr5 small subunit
MQNLEQIRARNALACSSNCPDDQTHRDARKHPAEGDALAGYPSLIINNGLLATVAFSVQKGDQMERIANAIAYHLSNLGDGLQRTNLLEGQADSAHGLLTKVSATGSDALLLQRCTAEALAFLAYLKRFAAQ